MSSCQQPQIQRPMSQAPRDPSTTASTMVASGHTTEHRHTERGLELKRSQFSIRSDVKMKECGYFKRQPKAVAAYLRVQLMNRTRD